MARLKNHKITAVRETIQRIKNCPLAPYVDGRLGHSLVDEISCRSCVCHDWQKGCVYAEALIPTIRETVWDEKSRAAYFFWRFNCHHCGHPVAIASTYEMISVGDVGRCMGCGAYHHYIMDDESETDRILFVVSKKTDLDLIEAVKSSNGERSYDSYVTEFTGQKS